MLSYNHNFLKRPQKNTWFNGATNNFIIYKLKEKKVDI